MYRKYKIDCGGGIKNDYRYRDNSLLAVSFLVENHYQQIEIVVGQIADYVLLITSNRCPMSKGTVFVVGLPFSYQHIIIYLCYANVQWHRDVNMKMITEQ